MGYTIARRSFKVLSLSLPLIIIPLAISLIQVVAALQRKDFPADFYSTTMGWFLIPGRNLLGTSIVVGTFFFLLILTGIITTIGEIRNGGLALKKYLRDIAAKSSCLKPVGFSQQSALISVSVPLEDIFIHLHAATDRPRFDLPTEQLKYLEELRKRADLTSEQREEEIQALRVIWYSQLGPALLETPQNINIVYTIQQLTAQQPGAVILGAPGSGKSTTMSWLTYSMTRAIRLPRWQHALNALLYLLNRATHKHFVLGYSLPDEMAPAQIPVRVRINEYAKVLGRSKSEEVSFQEFFRQCHSKQPELAERLLHELKKGRCLLLLDGLDEVANDELRRHVAENIATFVTHYSPENPKARRFNRFIITSRIVGYEAGTFANYAHYTLQDLEDKQIEQFLDNWCPAVERHQKTFAQGMKRLTPQQTEQANQEGQEQKERLWEALQQSPGIKRLAVNPLMLTILALIQRSGKTLPHRRIELYQIVTRTLLDNWNQEKGRRVFPEEELPLAEDMLSCLAYEMHGSDRLLTEAKVKEIAGKSMYKFFQQQPAEKKITSFIDTLRSSSGLFIETGQGFFSFMHRTFQEYFVAQYLLHQTFEQLKQAVKEYSHKAMWHEPLLLLVAYKSTQQSNREEQQHASDLIHTILETCDDYDEILQRNLLLAANCVVDCSAWSVRHDLQHRIANRIFDIYSDALETRRYTALQEDIERIVLLWLKGQPVESSDAHPPFLDAWCSALCDASQPVRQEGAAHLLAALAPDLPGCPEAVLTILLPPLLQLADIVDITSPPDHIRKQLSQTKAPSATLRVTEYALVTLRLLDESGPAGWLHKEWVQWNKEKPELLEQLTKHALELDYLLTPAAIPASSSDLNWNKQHEIGKKWKKYAKRNARELQSRLLQASTTARFPHAWLFKKLLLSEETSATQNIPWQVTWNKVLREEMERGNSVTYQSCLDLRLLLTKGDELQRRSTATELLKALSLRDQKQVPVLNLMINIHSVHNFTARYLRDILEIPNFRGLHELGILRADRVGPGIRDLLELLNLRYLLNFRDFLEIRNFGDLRVFRDVLNILYLRDLCDIKYIIELFSSLKQGNAYSSLVLLCIYRSSMNTNYKVLLDHRDELTHSLQEFARATQQQHSSTIEQRLLVKRINQILSDSIGNANDADERAKQIAALRQQEALNKNEIAELLAASTDTRKTTKKTWQHLTGEDMTKSQSSPGSVGNLAWKQLSQQWKMDADAREVVIQKLDDSNAIICAAATLILQQNKQFTEHERKIAAQKIMMILRDEDLSRRTLDPPERYSGKIWQLDDVLFETLGVLAE